MKFSVKSLDGHVFRLILTQLPSVSGHLLNVSFTEMTGHFSCHIVKCNSRQSNGLFNYLSTILQHSITRIMCMSARQFNVSFFQVLVIYGVPSIGKLFRKRFTYITFNNITLFMNCYFILVMQHRALIYI